MYGVELSTGAVGDEFAIVWNDVRVEQLHVAVVGDGVEQGESGQFQNTFVFTK